MAEEQEEINEDRAKEIVREFSEARETTTGFFTRVVKNPDTTKTGNLSIDELGMPSHTVRGLKELGLFCRDIGGRRILGEHFDKLAEINLATSLSKDGTLLKLVGTTRREIADVSPKERKVNKSWYKKKEPNENQNQQ